MRNINKTWRLKITTKLKKFIVYGSLTIPIKPLPNPAYNSTKQRSIIATGPSFQELNHVILFK
jgi:hypothetical protein